MLSGRLGHRLSIIRPLDPQGGLAPPFGGSPRVDVEIIKEALMHWGEAIHVSMENRTLFYSPVLDHWRVKKWAGKSAKGFIYDGDNFMTAFEYLLGAHAAEHPPALQPHPPAPSPEIKKTISRALKGAAQRGSGPPASDIIIENRR